MDKVIDKDYLKNNPDYIFVFGDNCIREGLGGAAALRYEPNTYGFLTKKFPDNRNESFFTPTEYYFTYMNEIKKLKTAIVQNPHKKYLISKLGSGLANKYNIFERVIEPNIRKDLDYPNVEFLW